MTPIEPYPDAGRRQFLRTAASAVALASLGGAASAFARKTPADEAGLLGSDPDRRGPFRFGKEIYRNPLTAATDVAGCRLEGEALVSFPNGRMRLENKLDSSLGQKSNFVYWFPQQLPADFAASWEFRVIRDPGLCMVFFAASGRNGEDLFSSALPKRDGDYAQYHHGAINALHLSYYRKSKAGERSFQVCNLRKSSGFHLVAEGADPLPTPEFADPPYFIDLVKVGPRVAFFINRLPVLQWTDDGRAFGPPLGGGYLGFRQMAPLQAEYQNLVIREVSVG